MKSSDSQPYFRRLFRLLCDAVMAVIIIYRIIELMRLNKMKRKKNIWLLPKTTYTLYKSMLLYNPKWAAKSILVRVLSTEWIQTKNWWFYVVICVMTMQCMEKLQWAGLLFSAQRECSIWFLIISVFGLRSAARKFYFLFFFFERQLTKILNPSHLQLLASSISLNDL